MKTIMITDSLHNEFKYLTANQIKIILYALSDNKTRLNSFFHNHTNRLKNSYTEIYTNYKEEIDIIRNIKSIKIEGNKEAKDTQKEKLKKELKQNTYYKVPLDTVNIILDSKYTKIEIIFILQVYSVMRNKYKKTHEITKKQFVQNAFGEISRKELCVKKQIFDKMISDISVTFSDISVTNSDISVTFSDISVTNGDISVTHKASK